MQRILFWTVLLFLMWMVLTANIQLGNIVIGLGISVCIALLYTKIFEHTKFEMINPYWFLIYILVLIKNLINANIDLSKRILSKDMKLNPSIVEIKTELKSDWKKLLLANSITLTPGTITLDIKDDMLYIHTIECKDTHNKVLITKEFEDIIAKI